MPRSVATVANASAAPTGCGANEVGITAKALTWIISASFWRSPMYTVRAVTTRPFRRAFSTR